jgi:cytochrome c553
MRLLKLLAVVFVVVVAVAVGAVAFLKSTARARYAKHYEIAVDDIPVPFPLNASELQHLGAAADGKDLQALALERAVERGRHYVATRAACAQCHGSDFAGKVMIDNPIMGRWAAPNITRGGVTKSYKGRDWVMIVRHGIKHDGTAASMPSRDYTWFSDQEISDIAAYISSLPPVERVAPTTVFGPVFSLLIAKGDIPVSAEVIDHLKPRPKYPPAIAPTVELGEHLAAICTGCHSSNFAGGPIAGGDPSWPPARNITFHPTGIATWKLADFKTALRKGTRPDGSKIVEPMPIAYTSKLLDAEIEALYLFLKAQPALPYSAAK